MKTHPTHDFPPISASARNCRACGCLPWAVDAELPCKPVTFDDDPRAATEAERREVWR